MIQEYRFNSIVIKDETYDKDVEVRWTGEVLLWKRQESHAIDIEDVKRAVEQKPEVIVIGTGESGMARITEGAQNFIRQADIRLITDKTGEAVRTFNVICDESLEEEGKQEKVIGLFHLTC
jgi:hypothetical protein